MHAQPLNYENLYLVREDERAKVLEVAGTLQAQHGVLVPREDTCPKLRAGMVLRLVVSHMIENCERYTGIGVSSTKTNDRLIDLIVNLVGCELDGAQLECSFAPSRRVVSVVDDSDGSPSYAFEVDGISIKEDDEGWHAFHLIERLTLAYENAMLKASLVRKIRAQEDGFAHSSTLDLADIEKVKLLCSTELKCAAFKYAVEFAPGYI